MTDIKSLDKTYIAGTYARFPVQLVSGKGSLAWDVNGKEYIVLLQPTEDPDADYEYLIMETVTVDGEDMLQTLTDKEADIIYDYYDKLCDELYGDDEESDE